LISKLIASTIDGGTTNGDTAMTFLLLLFVMALALLMALPNVEKQKTIIRIPPVKPRKRASTWPFTDSRSMFG